MVWLNPPMGLLYIASVLRDDGFRVMVLDFQNQDTSLACLIDRVRQDRPAWVGFTTNSDNIHRVLRLRDAVLRTDPSVLCVLGGPHVSEAPESFVSRRTAVVEGEGEYSALRLTRLLVRGEGDVGAVPGLTFLPEDFLRRPVAKRPSSVCPDAATNPSESSAPSTTQAGEEAAASGGSVHARNECDLGPFRSLSELPLPDYGLLTDQDRYISYLCTARGCPFHCNFCVEGSANRPYRVRPNEDVERELEALRERKADKRTYLMITDDTFTSDPKRVVQLCDAIDRVFPDKDRFSFYCEGRVNVLGSHTDLIHRLKESGLLRLQVGIESGSQDMLDSMCKSIRLDQVETVVETCEKADVFMVFGLFMFGLPKQRTHHFREALSFAKRLTDMAPGRFETDASILCPFPGTDYRTNARQWELDVFDPDFVTGDTMYSCFSETRDLARDTIVDAYQRFTAEMKKYYVFKLQTVPRDQLKRMISVFADFKVAAQLLRELGYVKHIIKLATTYERHDMMFLQDRNGTPFETCCPRRMSDDIRRVGDSWLVNEKSPFGYFLSEPEARVYNHFSGKLSVAQITERLAADGFQTGSTPQSRDKIMDIVRDVYVKSEDGLNAVLCTF